MLKNLLGNKQKEFGKKKGSMKLLTMSPLIAMGVGFLIVALVLLALVSPFILIYSIYNRRMQYKEKMLGIEQVEEKSSFKDKMLKIDEGYKKAMGL